MIGSVNNNQQKQFLNYEKIDYQSNIQCKY